MEAELGFLSPAEMSRLKMVNKRMKIENVKTKYWNRKLKTFAMYTPE